MAKKHIILLMLVLLTSLELHSQDSTFWMELMQPEIGEISSIRLNSIGYIFIGSPNGLFRSTDDGNTWTRPFNDYKLQSFAIGSNDWMYRLKTSDNINYKLFKSTDFGSNWNEMKLGFSIPSSYVGLDSSNTLYLISWLDGKTVLTYHSIDYGITWNINKFDFEFNEYIERTRLITKMGDIYSAGYFNLLYSKCGVLLKSLDKGKSWNIDTTMPIINSIKAINEDTLLFCTQNGLYLTKNKGIDFKNIYDSLNFKYVEQIKNNELLATTINKIIYSTDLGTEWKSVNEGEITKEIIGYNRIKDLLFSNDYLGFIISTDKGYSWKRSNHGFSAANIAEMAEDSYGNLYAVGHPGGVYKSTDNGLTWIYLGLITSFIANISINTNNDIFVSRGAYSSNDGVFYRSTDGGLTWEDKSNGIYTAVIDDIFITKKGYIMINGMHISTDNGDSWSERKVEGDAYCFAYNSEGHLFRGGYDGIFYRSTDEGQTWEKMKKIVNHKSYEFYSMVFSPYSQVGFASGYSAIWNYSEPSCLKTTDNGRSWFNSDYCGCLAVDSLAHIWNSWSKTTDDGENWINYGYDLPPHPANTLFVDHQGYIYLALKNSGIFRSRDCYVSVPETQEPPGSRDGLSASPNPASDYIEISGISPPAMGWGEDRIRIYNALGEIILTVEAIHELPLRIDVSGLPPGLYFVRLGNTTRKFIKI